jgi:TrmH family RNA methyltransferase
LITSAHNPKVQRLRALLAQRKERQARGEFAVEGVRLFEEALAAGWEARLVLYSNELSARGLDLVEECRSLDGEVEEVDPRILKAAADTETPQGILGVFAQRELPWPLQADLLVAVDGLRDPGNLGTLLRSALAAGAQGVLLAPGSVDPFSPKVLRAGMGAQFRIPVREFAWDELAGLLGVCKLYTAEAGRGIPCWDVDLRGPVALGMGAEAEGVSARLRELAAGAVMIPMPGKSESINAAVAAGVLLFEVVRQRRSGVGGINHSV